MKLKRQALKYSSTADQSQEAARSLIRALFDEADDKGRADLLEYFADCHDHSAAILAANWGKKEGGAEPEERLQLHMLVAGASFYILSILEYLLEESST